MLKYYVNINDFKVTDKLFPNPTNMKMAFVRAKNEVAEKLQDPQMRTMRLYDLRHYFGTVLYQDNADLHTTHRV